MTELLYLDDMFLKEFEAKVVFVNDNTVVLDRTAFYPRSGGVACDTGEIIRKSDGLEFKVIFVGKSEGEISHEVDHEGLKEGDEVIGRIEWERRYRLMRHHTAAHILSGAFWVKGNVKIGGNEIDIDGGRMDFTLEDFDRDKIESYVEKANEIVFQDLSVEIYHITREELEVDPNLTKLLMGLPEDIERVRIVDIKGFDKQPDGGCHVIHTSEIGRIKLTKMKNKGKNNRRMYFILEND
jgi:misacylated tRNA(Ala) deacylase